MLYNWTGALSRHRDGKHLVVAEKAASLQNVGYSAADAYDVLTAEYLDDDNMVTSAINHVYGEDEDLTTASNLKEMVVVPASYKDIEACIEDCVVKYSAQELVEKLSENDFAVVTASDKTLQNIYNCIKSAKKGDRIAMKRLHSELKPWMEEAMLSAINDAEYYNNENRVNIKADREYVDRYRVSINRGKKIHVADVSLEKGLCSCPKYREGNYADFGLACEHLILTSPDEPVYILR